MMQYKIPLVKTDSICVHGFKWMKNDESNNNQQNGRIIAIIKWISIRWNLPLFFIHNQKIYRRFYQSKNDNAHLFSKCERKTASKFWIFFSKIVNISPPKVSHRKISWTKMVELFVIFWVEKIESLIFVESPFCRHSPIFLIKIKFCTEKKISEEWFNTCEYQFLKDFHWKHQNLKLKLFL